MSNFTKTPGLMYALRQEPSTLFWQVVPLDAEQGAALKARGEKHVYDTSTEAYAVRLRLNLVRGQTRQVVHPRLNFDPPELNFGPSEAPEKS